MIKNMEQKFSLGDISRNSHESLGVFIDTGNKPLIIVMRWRPKKLA